MSRSRFDGVRNSEFSYNYTNIPTSYVAGDMHPVYVFNERQISAGVIEDEQMEIIFRAMGDRHMYRAYGHVVSFLFTPAPDLKHYLDAVLSPLEGTYRVGVQLRSHVFRNHGDDFPLASETKIRTLLHCAGSLIRSEQPTSFVIITDSPPLRKVASAYFEQHYPQARVTFTDVEVVHTTDASIDTFKSVLVDWLLFGFLDDAVVTLGSNFAQTSFSRTLRSPITIGEETLNENGKGAPVTECPRMVQHKILVCPFFG
eukprot:JP446188.1.p2 GENE.JP446188.1~~JP446188.1.p2  ORF type:complete len:257 (+),score=44.00 JP446188.1:103-873(+)